MKVCVVDRLVLKKDLLKVLNKYDIDYEIVNDATNAFKYAQEFDLLFLPGGPDINPKRYNEEINGAKKINDTLDDLDFKYLEAFNNLNKPILGICRGLQSINVFFGGSLNQDIENHNIKYNGTHKIKINHNNFIFDIYKKENISVNSRHHQSIKRLADGFKICALSDDGIIEGINRDNIYAVQWHPETMYDYDFFNYFFK